MDMGSKIFSSILCTILFLILDRHGVKYQFGSTPGVVCQDGIFTIKILLHLRHNHNLPTWVLFADLVKDFDTSNHQLMDAILGKYGFPPKLRSAIARMYKDSVVGIIIGKNLHLHTFQSWCQTGWQHGTCTIPLHRIGFCRDSVKNSGSNLISINSNSAVTTIHQD